MSEKEENGKQIQQKTLFVRNLPFQMSNEALEKKFEQFGPIKSCFVVADPKDISKNRGFGYVKFSLSEDAENAMKTLNSSLVDGRKFKISYAGKKEYSSTTSKPRGNLLKGAKDVEESKDEETEEMDYETLTELKNDSLKENKEKNITVKKSRSQRSQPLDSSGRTLLIFNLPLESSSDMLQKECSQFGKVLKFDFPFQNSMVASSISSSSSCALVEYETYKQCRRALSYFDGAKFQANVLKAFVQTKYQHSLPQTLPAQACPAADSASASGPTITIASSSTPPS
eukprot:Sdes_comp19422_c0_seq2m10784